MTVLADLIVCHEIDFVVSNPDTKQGRSRAFGMSPVKQWALERGLVVMTPSKLTEAELLPLLNREGVQALAVAAYGKLLPAWLLNSVPYGAINVHASLLPAYRGAAPIERSLMDGCAKTGITIMRLDEGMDTGDTLAQVEVDIDADETGLELRRRLAKAGGELLCHVFDELPKGTLKATKQTGQASYAPKIVAEERWVGWSRDASSIHNLVRALAPRPGARMMCLDKTVKILRAAPVAETESNARPGQIISLQPDLVVATAAGDIALLQVQPPNKRAMTGAEFARGARLTVGRLMAE